MAGDQLDRDDGDRGGGSGGRGVLPSRLTFGWLKPDELQADPELDEIIAAQYAEYGSELEPSPDWERMRLAANAKLYRVWAARDDGRMVAWVEFNVGRHWHYGDTIFAWDCGHFCLPEYRPWTWLKLWDTAAIALKEIGVKYIIGHANRRKPLDAVFKRLGFEPHGQMFQKVL